ncbi:MAG: type II toxin-antitoxin system HicA family toxin [Ferruginibacter sp.]
MKSFLLEKNGVVVIRINGSLYRMKHTDGRVTTIPVHKNNPIPTGLLRKILREDIKITPEELKHSFSIYTFLKNPLVSTTYYNKIYQLAFLNYFTPK